MTMAAVRDRERVGACRAEDGHAKPDVDARYRDKDHPVPHSGYGSDLLLLESRKSMESVQTLRRQPSERDSIQSSRTTGVTGGSMMGGFSAARAR